MNPHFLVTGANGFIGSNVCAYLLEAGSAVRAMVQPGTSLENLNGLAVETVEADLLQPESLAAACLGTDYVIHLAAKVIDWGPWEEFRRVNVAGTKALLQAAGAAKVRRFLMMSSLAVHEATGHVNGDELAPRTHFSNPYARSKIEAEDAVRAICREVGMQFVIVRPGVVPYGPNDRTSFHDLCKGLERRYLGLVNGGKALLCTVAARNLAHGLYLAAVEEQAAGHVFIFTDETALTWAEFFTLIAQAIGAPPPWFSLPWQVPYALAALWEGGAWLTGSKKVPAFTRYRIGLVSNHFHFTSRKARELLGYKPVITLDEGIKEAAEWYKGVKG